MWSFCLSLLFLTDFNVLFALWSENKGHLDNLFRIYWGCFMSWYTVTSFSFICCFSYSFYVLICLQNCQMPVDVYLHFIPNFPFVLFKCLVSFILQYLSLIRKNVWKSLIMMVDFLISLCKCVHLLYSEAILLGM